MIGCREWEVRDCCLKSFGVVYFSNVWWDHIPDANCSGVKGEHCNVDAAPGGYQPQRLDVMWIRDHVSFGVHSLSRSVHYYKIGVWYCCIMHTPKP